MAAAFFIYFFFDVCRHFMLEFKKSKNILPLFENVNSEFVWHLEILLGKTEKEVRERQSFYREIIWDMQKVPRLWRGVGDSLT